MPKVFIENPQSLSGNSQDQLQNLYRYLTRMSEQLNEALNSIGVDQMDPEIQAQLKATTKESVEKSDKKTYTALKSLIIKTADIVHSEMDVISTTLESNYQAISDQFGELNQSLEGTITATAEGILQDYRYEERIQGLEDAEGNTDSFIRKTNQYIFSGLVDDVNMKYGIAIGENVTAEDQNGNPVLNHNNKSAVFTMDRLSFYQGGVEVAYFSNSTMYINQAAIGNWLQIGDHHAWKTMANGAIALINI